MVLLLTDVVLTVTGFQLTLLAAVLLKQKSINRLNRNLLVAFLLSKTFLILRWFLFRFGILIEQNPKYIYYITCAGFFLLAPLLYLYIKSLCYKDFVLKKTDIFHLIPCLSFIIFAIISVRIQFSITGDEPTVLYKIISNHFWDIFWSVNFVQILFYIIAMLKTVYIYQTKLKNLYSSLERINLNWLVSLLTVIFLHWLFTVSRATLSILDIKVVDLLGILDLFSITIFLVFTTILVFKGLNQLKIFTGIEEKLKYAGLKLSEDEAQQYIGKLTHYMKTNKPYLEPSLTINDLSEQLSIPSWRLSQVINDSLEQNFFKFVNNYRVEEVKNIFQDPLNNNKTILQILYEAGFNSKSTFNNVFKKSTGMTPHEFKRLYQN